VMGLLCVELHRSAFSSMATRRNLTDQGFAELVYLTLMHIRWKMHTFLLRVTVTIARTQMALLTQTSHSGLAVKTVDLLYLYSTGLQTVQVGYIRELLHIRTDPSALSVLTARQRRQAVSISHLKINDTRHNRHWLVQCKRIRCL
jgi:hypothetical protein